MKILILPKDRFPLNRPMLRELWCKEMTNLGCNLFWILQTEKSGVKIKKKKMPNNVFYLIPKFGNNTLFKTINIFINFFFKLIFSFILAKNHNIKLIHVHNAPEEGIIAYLLSKLLRIKFTYAYTSHFLFSLKLPIKNRSILETKIKIIHNFIRKKLYKIVLKKANIVFPISENLLLSLEKELKLPQNKMSVVPECASSLFLRFPINKKNLNPNGLKKIVYIGSLGKRRKIDFMIDMFQIVSNKVKNVKFYLIGWGEKEEDEPFLKQYVSKRKLSSLVQFVDKIPYYEIPKILSKFDIGLSLIPPIELYLLSTPTKCVEYLSLGLPVVANREIYDQKQLIESSNGGILTDYKVEEAADGVISLLSDVTLRAQCSRNGREWIEKNRTFSEIAKNVFSKISALQTF